MAWLVAIVLAALLYWILNKGQRTFNKTVLRQHNKIKGDRITYTELASQRHNLRTAHNMIKLDLVITESLDDEKISYLYAGGDHLESRRLHQLAHRFGLVPNSTNFVGY